MWSLWTYQYIFSETCNLFLTSCQGFSFKSVSCLHAQSLVNWCSSGHLLSVNYKRHAWLINYQFVHCVDISFIMVLHLFSLLLHKKQFTFCFKWITCSLFIFIISLCLYFAENFMYQLLFFKCPSVFNIVEHFFVCSTTIHPSTKDVLTLFVF